MEPHFHMHNHANSRGRPRNCDNPQPRPTPTRQGDWVCYYCGNYNYAFRQSCNRCQIQPHMVQCQYGHLQQPQSQGRDGQTKWKIDQNITHQDPMSNNHFQKVLFLTPPKAARRNSSVNNRRVLGAIENNEPFHQKVEADSWKWVTKIIQE